MPVLKGDKHTRLRGGSRADRRLGDARRRGGRTRGFRVQPLDRRRCRRRRFDGFDATENIDEALTRAADSKALIVLAVPVPALPLMLAHIRDSRTGVPADRRDQREGCSAGRGAVLRPAGALRRRPSHGRHGTLGLDCGQPPVVRRSALGDQRRRPRRRRRLDHGDEPRAGLRRGRRPRPLRRARRRGRDDLASAAPARRGPRDHRGRGPAGVRAWPQARSATAPGWRPPPPIWCAPCARPTPTSCCPSSSARLPCSATRATRWPRRARWPIWSRPVTPPACATTASARPEIVTDRHRRRRTGAKSSPPRVARAG